MRCARCADRYARQVLPRSTRRGQLFLCLPLVCCFCWAVGREETAARECWMLRQWYRARGPMNKAMPVTKLVWRHADAILMKQAWERQGQGRVVGQGRGGGVPFLPQGPASQTKSVWEWRARPAGFCKGRRAPAAGADWPGESAHLLFSAASWKNWSNLDAAATSTMPTSVVRVTAVVS